MAPFRASRSTRSGRPGGPSDQDVFDGLPVRQWRLLDSGLTPSNEANGHVANKQDATPAHQNDPQMPKGYESYKPYCIQILKAARAGKFLKANQAPANVYSAPVESDNNKAKDKPPSEAARGIKRSAQPSLLISKWTQVPKNLEEPELEYLAKRRKGLDRTHQAKTVTWAAPADTSHMRKTKVRKEDEDGQTQILEVMVPEGKTVQGEIKEDAAADAVAPVVAAPAPGTVFEGLGVTNEQGVIVATEGVLPLKRKHGPPRKKKKPRGRKKMTETAGTGVSASVEALQQQTGEATPLDLSSSADIGAQADTPMSGTKDTGEEDDIEEEEEGSEEEDEEGDEAEHEGEVSEVPDAHSASLISNGDISLETDGQVDQDHGVSQPIASDNGPKHGPPHTNIPDELPDAPPLHQNEVPEAPSAPSQEVEIKRELDSADQHSHAISAAPSLDTAVESSIGSTNIPPVLDPAPPSTSPAVTEPPKTQEAIPSLPPDTQPHPEPTNTASSSENVKHEEDEIIESIEAPVPAKSEEPQAEAQPTFETKHGDPPPASPGSEQKQDSSSPSPLRPSPEPLSPLSQPSLSPTVSHARTQPQKVREVDTSRKDLQLLEPQQSDLPVQPADSTSVQPQPPPAQEPAGTSFEPAPEAEPSNPTERREPHSTRIPPGGP